MDRPRGPVDPERDARPSDKLERGAVPAARIGARTGPRPPTGDRRIPATRPEPVRTQRG
ncbi:hypothetical protein STXM2123_954 [Streptomyces sp. F-3]|nr:hypothetical protein STXM2123_954 [Streptomyces sp. F-3]